MTIRNPPPRPRKDDGPRINESIVADQIRVIGADGEQAGIMTVSEALQAADDAGLDLVEVSPNASPPVCKILDYGKYKYEQQKKANEARKSQKTVDVKEVKFRPRIEDHDYGVKIRNARRFLENGDKVKVTLRYRGREIAHQEFGLALMERVRGDLEDVSKIELAPKMEGRQAIMILAPEATGSAKPEAPTD